MSHAPCGSHIQGASEASPASRQPSRNAQLIAEAVAAGALAQDPVATVLFSAEYRVAAIFPPIRYSAFCFVEYLFTKQAEIIVSYDSQNRDLTR
jgi:hypothetical protein